MELKPKTVNKGQAVATYMKEAPFDGDSLPDFRLQDHEAVIEWQEGCVGFLHNLNKE